MLYKFIASHYLRFILVIFIALQLFFMAIDIMKYADRLPDSANLLILFLMYDFLYALNYTFPIAVILGAVVCYITLVRSNAFSAILSIGYSKKRVLLPILAIAGFFNLCFIGLNATSFVYAQENMDNIISGRSDAKNDLLVKYGDDYVYMGKIFPLTQEAENIKIFETKNMRLVRFIQAKRASFDGIWWNLHEAIITHIPLNIDSFNVKLQTQNALNYKILENFKPKTLDTIYQNKPNVSIIDALNALNLLQKQNLNTQKIRSILYSFIAIPLAIPFCIIIISYYVPSLARYANMARLGFSFVLFSLIIWGLFFMLTKLSISGFLQPEFGVLAPLGVLIFISIFYFKKI